MSITDIMKQNAQQNAQDQVKMLKLLKQVSVLLPALREIVALVDECTHSDKALGLIKAEADKAIAEATAINPWAGEAGE